MAGDGFPIRVVRRGGILSGAFPMDDEAIRGLPAEFTITGIRQRRSLPQLRMFWALMQILAENSDQGLSKEDYAAVFKLKCGLATPVKMRSGKIEMIPRSISFDRLDQSTWDSFFSKVLDVVERMMPGATLEAQARVG